MTVNIFVYLLIYFFVPSLNIRIADKHDEILPALMLGYGSNINYSFKIIILVNLTQSTNYLLSIFSASFTSAIPTLS